MTAAARVSAAREMRPFQAEPPAMPVGTPGKAGYVYLGFETDDDGRSILRELDRRAPLIVQQALYFDECMPQMPCVYILSSGGPNVDGDRYEQHFTLRRGACAHISTGAATKLAEMRYNHSWRSASYSTRTPIWNICPNRLYPAVIRGSSAIPTSASTPRRRSSTRRYT